MAWSKRISTSGSTRRSSPAHRTPAPRRSGSPSSAGGSPSSIPTPRRRTPKPPAWSTEAGMLVDRNLLLPHRIAALAEESHDRLALRDVAGRGREPDLTWSDVQRSVLHWAGAYRRLGLEAGQTVLTM